MTLAKPNISSIFLLAIAIALGIGNIIFPIEVMLICVGAVLLLVLCVHTPLTLLAMVLILAPLRTLIATESPLNLPLDIGQLLMLVYLAGWVMFRIYQQKPIIKATSNMIWGVVLFVVIVFGINMWASLSISAWLTEWLKWIIIAVFVWHITLSERYNWQWLILVILASAVANAFVGLYIFFGGSGADHLVIGGRFFRAFGTFGQPNPFGGFMGISLPLSMMGAYSRLSTTLKYYRKNKTLDTRSAIYFALFALASGILFAGLIASWSRGAWLGFMISSAVMVFAIPRKLAISLSLTGAMVIFVGGLWIGGLIPQSIINRLTTAATDFITIEEIRGVDITTVNYAVVERIAHWQAAINMAESNPIMGVGLGNYEIVYDNFRLLNWDEPLGHAHNYYLNILAETGIMGFLAYLTFWVVIFVMTWKARQHPDPFSRCIAIGLLGSWTYIAVHSVFDNLYVNNLFLHIGILLSILAILHQQVWQSIKME